MVSITGKNKINLDLNVDLIIGSENHKKELKSFLEEQIEVWSNRKYIQSELENLEKEESEVLIFD